MKNKEMELLWEESKCDHAAMGVMGVSRNTSPRTSHERKKNPPVHNEVVEQIHLGHKNILDLNKMTLYLHAFSE